MDHLLFYLLFCHIYHMSFKIFFQFLEERIALLSFHFYKCCTFSLFTMLTFFKDLGSLIKQNHAILQHIQ